MKARKIVKVAKSPHKGAKFSGISSKRHASADARLTRDAIILAALHEAADKGGGNLSIRGVARRLGVYPTAVYWYVPDLESLHLAVIGYVLRDVMPWNMKLPWQQFIRDYFYRCREALMAYPGVVPLLRGRLMPVQRAALAHMERLLGVLHRAGFEGEELIHAYNTVLVAGTSFAMQEIADPPVYASEDWKKDVQESLSSFDGEQFPLLAHYRDLMANHAFSTRWESGAMNPLHESFRMYVEVIVEGLEVRLKRQKNAAAAP